MWHSLKQPVATVGTLLVAGLLVFVLAPASASATPVPGASGAGSMWSYGAIKSINVASTPAANGWVYEGSATLGYTVTIWENSTSSTTFELTVVRTMGLAFTVRFCDSTCGAPVQWANETFRAFERTWTFANFTESGTVTQDDTSVAAIALQNSTSFLYANVTEATDVFLPLAGQLGPHIGYLGAYLRAFSSVRFLPALGLIPDQLVPGTTWDSSSEFVATGSASWGYYYALHRPIGSFIIGPVSGGLSLSANGNVSVLGNDTGSVFSYGGSNYPVINLTIVGPFHVREGIILIPAAADIFGSSSQPWDGNATGSANVGSQPSTLDLKLSSGGEPRIIASSWKYSTAAANAAATSAIATGGSGVSPAATSANPVASGFVQGQPETTDQSRSTQQCLTSGASCLASGSTTHGLLGVLVVGGVVATLAVLIAVGVVTRRRRTPPPVYPNAVLYPPGANYPSAPAGGPATPPTPPPPEDDPLDHLW